MAGMNQVGECVAKRAESKLEVGLTNFNAQVENAACLSERLMRVANRIAGSAPEPVQNQKGCPVPPRPAESHLERMERLLGENAEMLESINRVVGRLEDSVG